jgi:hypothetical protein
MTITVFSSESLAQAYIDKHLSKADYQIETYNRPIKIANCDQRVLLGLLD